MAAFRKKIIRETHQKIECPSQSFIRFPDHDFIAAAEYFNLFAFNGEFFWQSYRLAIAGFKYTRCRHGNLLFISNFPEKMYF